MWQWLHTLLVHTTYEISIPVLRDSSPASEGKTGLIISVLFDNTAVRLIEERGWYEKSKELAGEIRVEVLSDSLYPGLGEQVIDRFASTPLTIGRLTENSEGAITGWTFTNPSMPAVHEMKRIMEAVGTPFPDIWQCGQWTFSPSGLPTCVLTGRIAAKEVTKRLHGRK